MVRPKVSYTIWFSQRTGSTLLCDLLTSTGVAGNPNEWLHAKEDILHQLNKSSIIDFQKEIWMLASSNNGVLGLKTGMSHVFFSKVISALRKLPDCSDSNLSRVEVWDKAFPNHHHIFMTRRNKVRLAVSWWKAIQTEQWHRQEHEAIKKHDLNNAYNYDAINQLYSESVMREAAISEFFAEENISPLNIVYEDFILDYEKTIGKILEFLGLDSSTVTISKPRLSKLADDVSEEWVQRFRATKQTGWTNVAW